MCYDDKFLYIVCIGVTKQTLFPYVGWWHNDRISVGSPR